MENLLLLADELMQTKGQAFVQRFYPHDLLHLLDRDRSHVVRSHATNDEYLADQIPERTYTIVI
jgi:hypothetical protein